MNDGYAIFLNDDGSETKLSWKELKSKKNGKKYGYDASKINDKEIGEEAFYNDERIKKIVISEGIQGVGDSAFCRCKHLEKVTLPSTLKKLEEKSFASTAIKEIVIPSTVEYVDSSSFAWCNQLEKITAPRGLYIDSDLINIVERTNEIAVSLQDFYNNCEKNDIKLFKEEIGDLEQGYFFIDLDENGNVEERDFSVYADVLKLKDSNGERYFTLFQLCDYYIQHRKYSSPDFDYSYILYGEVNDNIEQIVKYSEKLGIKPDLKNNINELKEQYTEKIEAENKAYQEYISKIEKEYNELKERENERDNTQVQANEHERD